MYKRHDDLGIPLRLVTLQTHTVDPLDRIVIRNASLQPSPSLTRYGFPMSRTDGLSATGRGSMRGRGRCWLAPLNPGLYLLNQGGQRTLLLRSGVRGKIKARSFNAMHRLHIVPIIRQSIDRGKATLDGRADCLLCASGFAIITTLIPIWAMLFAKKPWLSTWAPPFLRNRVCSTLLALN